MPGNAPVVMIVFDELSGLALMGPDGGIDAARFPNFARLAGDSTWYRNATTVADFTDHALPALLTGERPRPRRSADRRRSPREPVHAARRQVFV